MLAAREATAVCVWRRGRFSSVLPDASDDFLRAEALGTVTIGQSGQEALGTRLIIVRAITKHFLRHDLHPHLGHLGQDEGHALLVVRRLVHEEGREITLAVRLDALTT
mgnify:CR=1 FL=1